MNEPGPVDAPNGIVPDGGDTATAEQTALLRHFDLLPAEPFTRERATAFIGQLETAPDWQPLLADWHRDKFRLHPELFAAPQQPAALPLADIPQRSFREARWWQSQTTEGSLYGYSFRQPSVQQALVILESLDRQAPGWDRESKKRRTHRFMNELATLSPELCKPDCIFPHELPADDDDAEETLLPPVLPPSTPFVPSPYAATSAPLTAPSRPAWQPSVQPPIQDTRHQPAQERKGAGKWPLLLLFLAAGAGAYGYFGFHAAPLGRDDTAAPQTGVADGAKVHVTAPARVRPTVAAPDSQRRAMAKYPDLGKAGTPLNRTFVALVHQLEVQRSPRLQQPDWPERLADQCAKELLIAPSAQPSATIPPAPSARPATAIALPAATPTIATTAT